MYNCKWKSNLGETNMTTIETRDPTIDTFILLSYELLRGNGSESKPYERMHTVYSNFNSTFRKIFPTVDPVAYCQARAEEGLLQLSLARGGALLKPCLSMLVEPTCKQKALAKRYRLLLTDVVQKREVKKAAREAAKLLKPAGSKLEKRAQTIWQDGDIDAALKKLGY